MHKLDEILETADPGAVLVTRTVLDRLLLIQWKQPPLVGQVPRRDFVVMDRQILVNRVDSTELLISSDRNLPHNVLVLERPGEEDLGLLRKSDPFGPGSLGSSHALNTFDSDEHEIRRRQRTVLVEVWKRLFLAMVDRALLEFGKTSDKSDRKMARPLVRLGVLVPEGTIEFDEVSRVLSREKCVLPDSAYPMILHEFALVFLGLRCFSPQATGYWFPTLSPAKQDEIYAALGDDLPVRDLLNRSRLAPWLEAASDEDDLQSEANQYFIRLQRLADQSLEKGNLVDAAILRVRASRVAPAHKSNPARIMACSHLRQMVQGIHQRLGLEENQIGEATAVLDPLLEKADQGYKNREEKLLRELENIYEDVISPPQTLDLMGWILSGGTSRLRRPRILVDVIRATRFLRLAQQHLTFTRIENSARQSVEGLLRKARLVNETEVRVQIGPVLYEALKDAGFAPPSQLGQLALGQIVETLIDRILEQGFLTFQNLRDSLAVSPVKMPDLANFAQWVRGDELLRLDRRLATLLEGVYQPSELYGAMLERATAASFGTGIGRFISLFVLFPYLTAFVVVAFIYHLFKTLEHHNLGPITPDRDMAELWVISAAVGTVVLVFVARPRVRLMTGHILGRTLDFLTWTFLDLPRKVSSSEMVQSLVLEPLSWVLSYGVKPVLAIMGMRYFQPLWFEELAGWILWFVIFNVLLNMRPGLMAGALIIRSLKKAFSHLGNGLLGGAILLWQGFLKKMLTGIDGLILLVEEWISVRQKDEGLWIAMQALLQSLWFPLGYTLRFSFMVVIEPFLNPVKLPVCFVAMKIFYPVIGPPLHLGLDGTLNFFLVEALVWVIDFIIPGAFGFFFWEFRENWRLYEANRPKRMPPAMVGPQGETLRELLEPGFHAGTIPAVYRRLRKACDLRTTRMDFRLERACLREIGEICEDLARLTRRQFCDILGRCVGWQNLMTEVALPKDSSLEDPFGIPPTGFSVRTPLLATNRIVILLDWFHPGKNPDNEPLAIDMEFMGSRLFARVGNPAWLALLPPEANRSLTASLAWFFTQMGIGVSNEHLGAGLPKGFIRASVVDRAITLFPEEASDSPARLRTDWSGERIMSIRRDSRIPRPLPAATMIFGSVQMGWKDFVSWFEAEAKTPSCEPLFAGGVALNLLPLVRPRLVFLPIAHEIPRAS